MKIDFFKKNNIFIFSLSALCALSSTLTPTAQALNFTEEGVLAQEATQGQEAQKFMNEKKFIQDFNQLKIEDQQAMTYLLMNDIASIQDAISNAKPGIYLGRLTYTINTLSLYGSLSFITWAFVKGFSKADAAHIADDVAFEQAIKVALRKIPTNEGKIFFKSLATSIQPRQVHYHLDETLINMFSALENTITKHPIASSYIAALTILSAGVNFIFDTSENLRLNEVQKIKLEQSLAIAQQQLEQAIAISNIDSTDTQSVIPSK